MSYYSDARELHEKEQYKEAYELYLKGAEAGEEKCFYGIALFLYEGYFVKKNIKKANIFLIFCEKY